MVSALPIITAAMMLARESAPLVFKISVKIPREAALEKGLIIATEKTSGGMWSGEARRKHAFEKVVSARGFKGFNHNKYGQDIGKNPHDDADPVLGSRDKRIIDRHPFGKSVATVKNMKTGIKYWQTRLMVSMLSVFPAEFLE